MICHAEASTGSDRNTVAVSLSPLIIAGMAVASLHAELVLYPKPGLVSLVDDGSHADMTAATFMRSLFALRRYFGEITLAGSCDADFAQLMQLGVAAEQRMLRATAGINTHRGAIFFLGLLCAAAGHLTMTNPAGVAITPAALRAAIGHRWGAALARHCTQRPPAAHGTRASIVHGIGGARAQAATGMPAVFEIALPALQHALAAGRSLHCARTDAFFSLLAQLDDSNVYHRGGATGALLVRELGQRFMSQGGTASPHWRATALAGHRLLVARRLSPGGAADLLAATCLVHALTDPFIAAPDLQQPRRMHQAAAGVPTLHDTGECATGADR